MIGNSDHETAEPATIVKIYQAPISSKPLPPMTGMISSVTLLHVLTPILHVNANKIHLKLMLILSRFRK